MQHPMQAHMGAYPAHNVTTELIQKYLDENKQLILAILDNQNLGKLNECAAYQAKLQANLMYLAAIADSQPQPAPVHAAQVPQAAVMQQPGLHYMTQQQAQQQMAAQQSFLAARNSNPYSQQSYPMMHQSQQQQQQQQAMQGHHGMNIGASSSLGGMGSDPGLGGNNSLAAGNFSDFGRGHTAGNTGALGRELTGGYKSDASAAEGGHGVGGGNGSGHGDDAETSYLKASEEDGN